MTAVRDRLSALRRRPGTLVLLGLALAAAVVAVTVHLTVFPYLSPDHDEPIYLLQADLLRDGRLTLPPDQYPDHRPWLSGVEHGRLLLVFQPAWPAVLAVVRLLSGSFLPAIAVQAAVLVVLLYRFGRELTGDRTVGLVTAALAASSPFLWLRSGTFLAYLFSFGLELAFLTLLLAARRTGSGRRFIGAGAVLGLLFVARPFDALVVAALAGAWTMVELRRQPGALAGRLARLARLAIGGLPGAVAAMGYNTAVTGRPLRFALHAAGGANEFGFGDRRIAAGTPVVRMDLVDALWAMGHNLLSLGSWLAGGWLLVPLVVAGLWQLRANRTAIGICAVVLVAFPLANLAYWGNLVIARNRDYLGPHYYLPLLAPLAVAAASALVGMARRRPRRAGVGVLLLAVATAATVVPRIEDNLQLTRLQRIDHVALAAAGTRRAVVVLPRDADGGWIGHPRPSLLNDADLDQDVIFAVDRKERSMALFDRFPDRSVWRMSWRAVPETTGLRALTTLDRLRRVRARGVVFDVAVRNTTGERVVAAYLTDGRRDTHVVLDDSSERGRRYRLRWMVGADGEVEVEGPSGSRTVFTNFGTRSLGAGTLAVGVGFGGEDVIEAGEHQEHRFWFRTRGDSLVVVGPGDVWTQLAIGSRRWITFPAPGLRVELTAGE